MSYDETKPNIDQILHDAINDIRTNEVSLKALIDNIEINIDDIETNEVVLEALINSNKERLEDLIVNVKDFGAIGDGVADDTSAIQNAIDYVYSEYNGGIIFLPPGTYKITSRLELKFNCRLIGTHRDSVEIVQANDLAGIYAKQSLYGVTKIHIKNILLTGNYSSNTDANGIHLIGDDGINVISCELENIKVEGFYNGIVIERPMTAKIEDIESKNNANDGFHIAGDGTSFTAINCFATGNGLNGWYVDDLSYSSLINCASDGNTGFGYHINGTQGFSLISCGAEGNTDDYFHFVGCYGLSVISPWIYDPDTTTTTANYFYLDGIIGFAMTGFITYSDQDDPDAYTIYLTNENSGSCEDCYAIGCKFQSIGGFDYYLSYNEIFISDIDVSTVAGTGIIFKTPDGSAVYKVALDNSGNFTKTLL